MSEGIRWIGSLDNQCVITKKCQKVKRTRNNATITMDLNLHQEARREVVQEGLQEDLQEDHQEVDQVEEEETNRQRTMTEVVVPPLTWKTKWRAFIRPS
jgi:hypothetical protein